MDDTKATIAKPNFHSRSIFSENLVAIEMRKLKVKFDKPIYVSICILDIFKMCLYEFHHECYRCFVRNVKSCTLTRTALFIISSATTYTML